VLPFTRTYDARQPRRSGGAAAAASAAFVSMMLLATMPAVAQLRGSLAEETPHAGRAETGLPAPRGPDPGYRVDPVAGAPAGVGVRRVIETFSGWTLICDEAKSRRICNASQSIVTDAGRLAFSWSLAATRGGEPIFIVRAPVTDFPARTVTLEFGTEETVMRLPSCDEQLCLGFLPLNAAIVTQIKARARVTIRYRVREGAAPVVLIASLDGLGAAIGSIR
jgi:invasion protein IalB